MSINIIIYFLVGLIATTIGAISGIGGGVIIKPVLDMLGQYDISTISLLSSFTVFSMAVVSLGKSLKNKVKLEGKRTVSVAIGSILGGTIGKNMFSIFLSMVNNDIVAQKIQSVILFILLLIVLVLYIYEDRIKRFNINNTIVCALVGLILGILAAFLGIGGGPLNVVVLMYLLGMDAKASAVHSIFIVFFSQGSKIVSVILGEGLGVYNLEVLIYMIIGGICGGFLGSYLSTKMNKEKVKSIFIWCMLVIMCFNLFNIIK